MADLSTRGGNEPLWARSGEELFYHDLENGLMVVDIETSPEFRPSSPRLLLEGRFSWADDGSYDVAPDGKRFLMVQLDEPPPPARIEVALHWFEELERLVPTVERTGQRGEPESGHRLPTPAAFAEWSIPHGNSNRDWIGGRQGRRCLMRSPVNLSLWLVIMNSDRRHTPLSDKEAGTWTARRRNPVWAGEDVCR